MFLEHLPSCGEFCTLRGTMNCPSIIGSKSTWKDSHGTRCGSLFQPAHNHPSGRSGRQNQKGRLLGRLPKLWPSRFWGKSANSMEMHSLIVQQICFLGWIRPPQIGNNVAKMLWSEIGMSEQIALVPPWVQCLPWWRCFVHARTLGISGRNHTSPAWTN